VLAAVMLTLLVMLAALMLTFTLVLAAFMLAFVLALMLTLVLTLMLALLYFGGITTAAFLLSVTAAATGHADYYHCHHQANYNLFHLYLLYLKIYLLFVAH
jgi:hypothetical protein